MGIPVQPTAEERIATTTNEKVRLLDLVNGSSFPDPSTLKDWLCESDAITSWPPIFLSDSIVFLFTSLSFSPWENGGSQSQVCVPFTETC